MKMISLSLAALWAASAAAGACGPKFSIFASDVKRIASQRCTERPPDFPKIGKARALTKGPKEHFLASYFGINSWSHDFRYVIDLSDN